jgi:hypothetical protein
MQANLQFLPVAQLSIKESVSLMGKVAAAQHFHHPSPCFT